MALEFSVPRFGDPNLELYRGIRHGIRDGLDTTERRQLIRSRCGFRQACRSNRDVWDCHRRQLFAGCAGVGQISHGERKHKEGKFHSEIIHIRGRVRVKGALREITPPPLLQ